MTRYSKFNLVYRLQKWMDSVAGQTFLNYAYSWGASIVILGTLFKLTHLPGANLMLFIGMGTEVLVFFISAFDRPFDKTADGMDLQTHSQLRQVESGEGIELSDEEAGEAHQGGSVVSGPSVGGTIIIGGGGGGVAGDGQSAPAAAAMGGEVPSGGGIIIGGGGGFGGGFTGGAPVAEGEGATGESAPAAEGGVVTGGGAPVSGGATWIGQQQQISPEMAEATSNYVEELNKLTELLGKVSEQSARLTRDSEEMENLNRTLTGICKVYEMQLKSASQQIGTIDQINEQSRKMAKQIEQLNQIYARMIEAMTINMRTAAPGAQSPSADSII
ncbi:MAG: gliding motility protein GldL [Prevotella sp.]|nr:gliding motility protein GldL [Prevotella sp.]